MISKTWTLEEGGGGGGGLIYAYLHATNPKLKPGSK